MHKRIVPLEDGRAGKCFKLVKINGEETGLPEYREGEALSAMIHLSNHHGVRTRMVQVKNTMTTELPTTCRPDVHSSDWLGVRSTSTLVPLYEARLIHAEANLKYWAAEYNQHGDPIAKDSYHAAKKTIGDVWQKLNMLKQPGAVAYGDA